MTARVRRSRLVVCACLAALATALSVPAAIGAVSAPSLDASTRFHVPKPDPQARTQIASLTSSGDKASARLIDTMISTPQSVWFTGGTALKVQQDVRATVQRATGKGTVPVLVAYNLPFRDCAQYSAGGATTVAEYEAWIDAFAAGIGAAPAVVILEPDGLGIIPWYKQFRGLGGQAPDYEWCQPVEADPATAADDRFAMLAYAVQTLTARPGAQVYLDGTHSGWLGAGDAAHRLVQAGVEDADGFFVNVSNYERTEHLEKYGRWISQCVWFGTAPGSWGIGHFDWCASQYYPANPNDFSTWSLSDEWYADNVESQTWAYPGDSGLTTFVIDTSRNGQGPWRPSTSYPDPQTWCNPPGRGLGAVPTADTAVSLVDAYLWVKIPGESDGECARGLGDPGATVDPEWGQVDPPAGEWFPEMAIDLARNANPPLE